MSVNIGNNEAEQFSNYRKTIDGTDEKGNTEDNLPEDITADEDDDVEDEEEKEEQFKEAINTNFALSGGGSPVYSRSDDATSDDDVEDEVEEEEFKEEINTNFPLSGGGTAPVDDL